MIKSIKKFIALLILLVTVGSIFSNCALASANEIGEAYIDNKGMCELNLQYFYQDENESKWVNLICYYVAYNKNGKEYPAYCLDQPLHGVGAVDPYTVDVTNALNDVRVWRTIANGYPYKTPAELGVQDKYDAFLATKEAVYCILYGYNPYTRFRGANARGNAIASAICKMTEIGRNGTQTPYSGGVSADKVGDVKEEGEYFSQEFKINCGVETSEYTITSTNGLPQGSKLTNMSNAEIQKFAGNEHFKVKFPKTELYKDINATFNIKAKAKTYPVFYGKTRIPGTQNYAITYNAYEDITGVANYNLKTDTGIVQINKVDAETLKPVEGVTFQLLKSDGTLIETATTNKEGIAIFSKLYQGAYVLKEIATNENYILNTNNFDIDVNFNKTSSITIENEYKRGNLRIHKVDKDNSEIALGNVEFDLYSEEFQKIVGTYHTSVNGELYIENLRIGNYSLIEKETNKWYNLAKDTDVKVEWETTKETTIENELKKGQVKIVKVDLDDNNIKLSGVKFNVYDENNKLLETLTTDNNGEAFTSKYPIRDLKKLTIKEIETLDNYVLNDEVRTIELEENKTVDTIFQNEKIKGYIEINKVSEDDNKNTGVKANTSLEGAKFEIYDSNNNLVQTLITNAEGKAKSNLLVKDTYTVKEINTGSKYYILNENEYKVSIEKHHDTIPITIKNQSVNVSVDVKKSGYIETQKNDTIKYDFSSVANTSNVYLNQFNWSDYLPTDYIRLKEIVTGTWNQDVNYSITYKTNLNTEDRILAENLNSKENYKLDCTNIGLQENEYITEYTFNFGRVDIGFKEDIAPSIFCKVLNTVKDKDTFINSTRTYGEYEGIEASEHSEWTTIVYEKDIKGNKLPKTGK